MKHGAEISIYAAALALCAYLGIGSVWLMAGWGLWVRLALYIGSGAAAVAATVFFLIKKSALLKTAFVLLCCAALVYTGVVILSFAAGLNGLETDAEKISIVTELIERAGGWSMAVFVLIQILQVVLLPLPAVVCYLPGVAVWGPLVAFLLASSGVLAGALICYLLGRVFGRKAVEWIAGKENADKYADLIGRRGKTLFVIMQILPFFPDDVLCLAAGMTKMNFPFFAVTMILVRPAIVAAYCYLGSGTVIPFSGWGIPVWIAIAVFCVALAVLSFFYQEKFENRLKRIFGGQKKDGRQDKK